MFSSARIRREAGTKYPAVGAAPVISEWDIRRVIYAFFEVAADRVRALVPPRLQLFEARPGVAVLQVSIAKMNPGNMNGELPEFLESVFGVLVHPDLAVEMPDPKFALYVFKNASENLVFLRNEERTLRLNTEHIPSLAFEASADGRALALADDRGPMLVLKNAHPERPPVVHDQFGQFLTKRDGQLYMGIWQWDGMGHQHQLCADGGRIHDHPFFLGLGAAGTIGDCYLQLVGAPDANMTQRFFTPWPIPG
jgi:hypothetical protein